MSHDISTKAQATRAHTARADSTDVPSLYDADILLWSEQQAALIRALGRRRDLPNDLDIENVAEEIESVGRSELAAVESKIELIILHVLKLVLEPDAPPTRHWRAEIAGFHADLRRRYSASMRQRIDLDALWRSARQQAALAHEGTPVQPVVDGLPEDCPFALDDFLGEPIDPAALTARLQAPPSAPA
ncbi:hypothetical protein CCR97_08515 [Rhodoplanes elegans]|uniref:DUF29 domain-containing protein n=1 Tax=Rhodoplanes elegans TaxID=29408 RepID=A0A327KQX7_9BRAD|nr:DUF29 domain-containing protein [Rhodoplanes elegans]MBK5958252.1 hypothetical protein [Rhodoplanes elegans]RAI40033.1 hypothetical protein CH338_07555 [Rhodoplanes elegans]